MYRITDQLERITGTFVSGTVRVTASLLETGNIVVACKMTGTGNYWREPSAAMVRSMVDDLASRNGLRRSGRRQPMKGSNDPAYPWRYRFATSAR